ncbi:hypothetical protein CGMCC3_g2503 [Colletotrichum fructicola]|nr:uncharacterized protein CGMCC3_g2503 [Colletotrichum fructicola]KAE9581200.1 hypothetical protein CGMCC3_g2503 [Colletotrichum fructicola]
MPSPPCHALPYPAPDTSTPIPTNESRSLKSLNPSSRPLFLLDMKIRVIAWKRCIPLEAHQATLSALSRERSFSSTTTSPTEGSAGFATCA